MRKNVIFAVIAAIASLASCQKENAVIEPQSEELVFTATIENTGTKTTINADKDDSENGGKIYWSENDEITIKDKYNKAVVYVAQSYGSTTTTFTKKITDPAQGDLADEGPYTATYGTAPSTSQSYSDYYSADKVAKNLYMTASSNTRSFTFTAACGLLKLNLASSSENNKEVSKIEIAGTPTDGSATVYTLTCDNESIASPKDFYIALPAGSYTLMKFTNSKGCVCFKKAKSAIEIEDNKIQPVTLSGITFSAVLPGKFTVASDKQVQFSAANLWCNTSSPVTYSFESAQNVTYSTLGQSSYTASHVCHFYWSKTASVAYAETYSDGGKAKTDSFFFGEGNSLTVDGQSGLYALTGGGSGEWSYLFSSRTNASSLYKAGVSVTTSAGTVENCLVIAPDGYTGSIASSYDAAAWAAAEASGLVCLPAAGYRYGSNLYDGGSLGLYWSATPNGGYEDCAYDMFFNGSNVYPSGDLIRIRDYGESVRLVCSVSAPLPAATTGTAKATINSQEVDVDWVQLWSDGPKFAVKNVGASACTDKGSFMSFADAAKTGSNYVWGSNWKTPSKDEMDLLNTDKVSCSYGESSSGSGIYGFKFTGVQEGYTGNSLFLPAGFGDSGHGSAIYWSSTADGSVAWYLSLLCNGGVYCSAWGSGGQSDVCYVRPVLSN